MKDRPERCFANILVFAVLHDANHLDLVAIKTGARRSARSA